MPSAFTPPCPDTDTAASDLAEELPVPAVSISGLSFFHDRNSPTLDGITLTVNQGDFLALIGPNGGGKTTLLRLMLGLLTPQYGTVSIFGGPPAAKSRHIGYVPQFSTMQPDFPASVLDLILMGGATPGIRGGGWNTSAAARDKARGYLELLGLGGLEKHSIGALSGGQRQRALVARALMGSEKNLNVVPAAKNAPAPFLLLLDEPTASIDPGGKFCFYEFLGNLRGKITMIVVSHDLFLASPFFSHVAFVNATLTPLNGNGLSPENLNLLFGRHLHDCPVADIQHAGGAMHPDGCTHPACRSTAEAVSTEKRCAACGEGESGCSRNKACPAALSSAGGVQ